MIYWSLFVACAVTADVPDYEVTGPPTKLQLTLTPSATVIRQGDNLLLRALLEVPSGSPVTVVVEPPHELDGSYIRIEIKEGEKWRRLRNVVEDLKGPACFSRYRWSFAPGTRYAEYNWFHRNDGAWIFSDVRRYELRAVAQLSTKELVSNTITIAVEKRSAKDLDEILKGRYLSYFGAGHLNWEKPARFAESPAVGGEVERTVSHFLMLHQLVHSGTLAGHEVPKRDMYRALRVHMDPVSWEHSLGILARNAMSKGDNESLARILGAAPPFETRTFHDAATRLDLKDKSE
jgi:hypothetical protein